MERTHQLPSCGPVPARLLGPPNRAHVLAARSREPSTSVRVVRRNDNMDTVGAAQTLLRATAQAAADAVLQPPSMSSTAAPSEVSTATVRRVVGRARHGNVLFQHISGFRSWFSKCDSCHCSWKAPKSGHGIRNLQLQSLEYGWNFNLSFINYLLYVFRGWGMRNPILFPG